MPSECRVCGNDGASRHYGAVVCGSCKIFFARAVLANRAFVCAAEGSCPTKRHLKERIKCRACRLECCIDVGMRAAWISRVDVHTSGDPPLELPDVSLPVPSIGGPSNGGIGATLLNELAGGEDDVLLQAKRIDYLQHLCDADDGSSTIPTSLAGTSIHMALHEALANPTAIAHRTPMGWSSSGSVVNSPLSTITIKLQWCRAVVHYIDWLSACPHIMQLSPPDKVSIAQQRMMPMSSLLIAYWTYRLDYDGYIMWFGVRVAAHPNPVSEEHVLVNTSMKHLHRHVVAVFRDMQLTHTEFGYLRMILQHNTTGGLSDEGLAAMRAARNFYINSLQKYIRATRPSLDDHAVLDRTTKMLGVLPHIMYDSLMFDRVFSRMVLFDENEMRGSLTHAFHFAQL